MLRREDDHVMRGALDFKVEGQRNKWKPKRTWKKQAEEESVYVGLRINTVLPQKITCYDKKYHVTAKNTTLLQKIPCYGRKDHVTA